MSSAARSLGASFKRNGLTVSSAAVLDPQAAANYALTLPGGPAKNQAISQLAQEWANKDPQATLEWLKQVPNPAIIRDAIERAMWSLGDARMVAIA